MNASKFMNYIIVIIELMTQSTILYYLISENFLIVNELNELIRTVERGYRFFTEINKYFLHFKQFLNNLVNNLSL